MSSDGVSYFTAAVVTAEKMKHAACQGHRIWLKLSVCMGHVPPMRTHTCTHTRSLSKIMLSGYEKLTTLCGEERALGRREPGKVKWQKPGSQRHRSPVGMLPHIHTSLKFRYLAPAEVAHTLAVYMSIQSIDLLNKHTVVFDSPFYLLGAFFFIASSIPQAMGPSHLCWGLGAGHTGLVGCGRTGLLSPGQWGPPRGSVHTWESLWPFFHINHLCSFFTAACQGEYF